MGENTPFWQEMRRSLMMRGDGWKSVIDNLPNYISVKEAKELLQSPNQLALLNGIGHIAGNRVETSLDKETILVHISGGAYDSDVLTIENIALQWLYRFIVVEGLVEHNRNTSLASWSRMFLHMVDQGLHFMVYMAALLALIEEGKLGFSMFDASETVVRDRIAEACDFLHPKAADYGESFRRHGLPGVLPRLWDKAARYAQLKADNRAGNFEKKEDSARDLLGYSIIAYSLMLELPKELRESYQPTSVYETDSNVMEGAEWRKVK